jgi:hypothetical protein
MGRGASTSSAVNDGRQLLFGTRKSSDTAARKYARQQAAWKQCFTDLQAGDPTGAVSRLVAGLEVGPRRDTLKASLVRWQRNHWLDGLEIAEPANKGRRRVYDAERTLLNQLAEQIVNGINKATADEFGTDPLPYQTILQLAGPIGESIVAQAAAQLMIAHEPDERRRLLDVCARGLRLHEEEPNPFLSDIQAGETQAAIVRTLPDRFDRGSLGFGWTVEDRIAEMNNTYCIPFELPILPVVTTAHDCREQATSLMLSDSKSYRTRIYELDHAQRCVCNKVNDIIVDKLQERLKTVTPERIYHALLPETHQWFATKWAQAEPATRQRLIDEQAATPNGVPIASAQHLRDGVLSDLQAFDAIHPPNKCRSKFDHVLREALQARWKPAFDDQREQVRQQRKFDKIEANQRARAAAASRPAKSSAKR